jgi:hypothetical protein
VVLGDGTEVRRGNTYEQVESGRGEGNGQMSPYNMADLGNYVHRLTSLLVPFYTVYIPTGTVTCCLQH